MLNKIACQHCVSSAQVVLRWHFQRGYITIPRTNKIEKLSQNISIFGFELSDEEMNDINSLNRNDFIRDYSRT